MIQEFVEECSITKIIIYYWLTNNIKHVNKLLSKITRLYMMIIMRNIIDLSSNPFEKYFPYSLLPVKSVLDVIIKIFFYRMLYPPEFRQLVSHILSGKTFYSLIIDNISSKQILLHYLWGFLKTTSSALKFWYVMEACCETLHFNLEGH